MPDPIPPLSTAAVDAKVQALNAEFLLHLARCETELSAKIPRPLDRTLIFESWAIQKIAGLQVVVHELAEKLNRLAEASGDSDWER